MASSRADQPAAASELDAGYVEDSGPGFDAREQITVELPRVEEPASQEQLFERWEDDTVRDALHGVGEGLHLAVGVGESDWKMTKTDLDRIAPPLTRIMNRYEPTARLAPYADPILVAQGAAQYAFRSMIARRAALAARQQQFEGYAVDDGPPVSPIAPEGGPVQEGYVPFAHRRQEELQ